VSTSDNDRIAYLSGDAVESLEPHERAELDQLRALLATPATWEQPDAALEDRVVNAIAEQARSQPGTATQPEAEVAAEPAAQPEPAPQPAAPKPQRRQRRQRRSLGSLLRRPSFALPAFATAAAAIAAVVIVLSQSNSPAPLQFAMVVSGTSLAPSAHGSAKLTKTTSGWRIQLSARGLPHLENGRYYQAWLKNAAGTLVPVGTFNDALNVTLWSGVPVTKFRTLTVTRQLANGNPASSGQRVLIGTIHSSSQ